MEPVREVSPAKESGLTRRSAAGLLAGGLAALFLAELSLRRADTPSATQSPVPAGTPNEGLSPLSGEEAHQDPQRTQADLLLPSHKARAMLERGDFLDLRNYLIPLLSQTGLTTEQKIEGRFLLGVASRELGDWEDAQVQLGTALRLGDVDPLRVAYAHATIQELNDMIGPAVPFGMVRLPASCAQVERWQELASNTALLAIDGPPSGYFQRWKDRIQSEAEARTSIAARWNELEKVGFEVSSREFSGAFFSPGALFQLARCRVEELSRQTVEATGNPEMARVLIRSQTEVFHQLTNLFTTRKGMAAAIAGSLREMASLAEYGGNQLGGTTQQRSELYETARWALRESIRLGESDQDGSRKAQLPGCYFELSRFETRVGNIDGAVQSALSGVNATERLYGQDSIELAISIADLLTVQLGQRGAELDPTIWQNRERLSRICCDFSRRAETLYTSGNASSAKALFDRVRPLLPFALPGHEVHLILDPFSTSR